MSQATTLRRGKRLPKHILFIASIAIIAGASVALMVSLAEMLKWQEGAGVMLGATALAGGAVFTILEMHRLGKEDH
jgi:hypothetical protein